MKRDKQIYVCITLIIIGILNLILILTALFDPNSLLSLNLAGGIQIINLLVMDILIALPLFMVALGIFSKNIKTNLFLLFSGIILMIFYFNFNIIPSIVAPSS